MTELMRSAGDDVDLAVQAILARRADLNATTPGTLVNTIAGVAAMLKRDAERFALREVARLYFSTARGADLDALAADRRELTRKTATHAVGTLLCSRSSSGSVVVPEGAVFTDPEGGRYLSTAEVVWAGASVSVSVSAEIGGADGNRASGLTWTTGTAAWADGIEDLTITNPEAIRGGNAEETDDEFRDRIYAWWSVQQRATAAALRYAALLVEGVRRATVDESHIGAEDGGYVDLYVSDGGDGYNAALGALVRAELANWQAAGVVVNVYGATVVNQGIQVSFSQAAGGAADAVARACTAILRYANNLAIGETMRRSQIARAGLSADSSLLDCDVTLPAADVVPTSGQVLRCPTSLLEVV